jgi:predicted alpha-1,2-mannosidase
VFLEKDKIKVDLTTTARCGIHRYKFPKWEKKKVIIDLTHRDLLLDSDLIFLNDSTLLGKRVSTAWAKEQHFYFTIQFSEKAIHRTLQKTEEGRPSKLVIEFGHLSDSLLVKVGMSAVDMKGAQQNLKSEMPHWNFEDYQKACEKAWDQELSKIELYEQNMIKKEIFYTALYHSYLNPNTFSDIDGRYRGMDMQIHKASDRSQYTIFSLWDTFRATHPLFTITQEKKTLEFIQTFLAQYEQGGILPIWELSANYTGCMIGYHAIPVIVDAYVKGIRGFDTTLALKAMLHSAEQNHLGLAAYKKQGYISSEDESESVSKTLEYAYDDWCIAVFADSLGKDSIAAIYYQRAQFYKNIFNWDNQFMQAKNNGGWKNNFLPEEVTFDYTEANSWQYSLFVPQDMETLMEMMGGPDSLEMWLDRLFTASEETSGRHQVDITGLIGQYAHGNEPSHHMAYLYNLTNSPWKTQKYVNQILQSLYSNQPDGLSGNEDCGQMSSWYVLSSLGFYAVSPGSPFYYLGTPLHQKATLKLENGNLFQVKAENYLVGNSYVQRVIYNGIELNRNYIHHNEIMAGGELVFEMGPTPSQFKGEKPNSRIPSTGMLSSPIITDPSPSFIKKKKLTIIDNNESATIHYSLDGSLPTQKSKQYKKPLKLKQNSTVTIRSFSQQGESYPVIGNFYRTNTKWEIELINPYHNQYSGGGDKALIDQIYGSNDFRTGSWQGYYGVNMEVIVDFKKREKINSIQLRLLQDVKSWIWYPQEVRFLISDDGQEWYTIESVENKVPRDAYGSQTQLLGFTKAIKTRYIKIIAVNMGPCPSWHPGIGNPSYIFADEIIIK